MDMPEPLRMKQLLIWCARHAIDKQRSTLKPEDVHIGAIAKTIAEDIVKDISENKLSVSWYTRDRSDNSSIVTTNNMTKNPQNESNRKKIKECQERIERLGKEIEQWNKLEDEFKVLGDSKQQTPSTIEISNPQSIDQSLLSESEVEFLRSVNQQQFTTADSDAQLKEAFTRITKDIEHDTDVLHESMHTVAVLSSATNEICDHLLHEVNDMLAKRNSERQSPKEDLYNVLKTLANSQEQVHS